MQSSGKRFIRPSGKSCCIRIVNNNPKETILTVNEFTGILEKLRERLTVMKNESNNLPMKTSCPNCGFTGEETLYGDRSVIQRISLAIVKEDADSDPCYALMLDGKNIKINYCYKCGKKLSYNDCRMDICPLCAGESISPKSFSLISVRLGEVIYAGIPRFTERTVSVLQFEDLMSGTDGDSWVEIAYCPLCAKKMPHGI